LEKDTQIDFLTNKLEKLEEEVNYTMKKVSAVITGLVAEAEDNDHFDALQGFTFPDD
jgi:hypothetical protein